MIDLSLKTQKSVTSTKQRNTILLIVYNIPYSKYQPNLDNYIGTSYNFNVNCADTLRLSMFFSFRAADNVWVRPHRFRYEVWPLGSGFRGFLYSQLGSCAFVDSKV